MNRHVTASRPTPSGLFSARVPSKEARAAAERHAQKGVDHPCAAELSRCAAELGVSHGDGGECLLSHFEDLSPSCHAFVARHLAPTRAVALATDAKATTAVEEAEEEAAEEAEEEAAEAEASQGRAVHVAWTLAAPSTLGAGTKTVQTPVLLLILPLVILLPFLLYACLRARLARRSKRVAVVSPLATSPICCLKGSERRIRGSVLPCTQLNSYALTKRPRGGWCAWTYSVFATRQVLETFLRNRPALTALASQSIASGSTACSSSSCSATSSSMSSSLPSS